MRVPAALIVMLLGLAAHERQMRSNMQQHDIKRIFNMYEVELSAPSFTNLQSTPRIVYVVAVRTLVPRAVLQIENTDQPWSCKPLDLLLIGHAVCTSADTFQHNTLTFVLIAGSSGLHY